jgi:general secretion pathway protein A
MSYYKSLGLKAEPFSTTPNPVFFFESAGHKRALNNILIEIKTKRGLSIIMGDIGTGKTLLSRKLIEKLTIDACIFHLIIDPVFPDDEAFLTFLARTMGVEIPPATPSESPESTANEIRIKEAIHQWLIKKAVNENKTMVLIIDEAQKLSERSLELLRTFLNYETEEGKLLQIVLLGQMELHHKLLNIPNLIDRVSSRDIIQPLTPAETYQVIEFRLRQAGCLNPTDLFSTKAIEHIHQYTHGYPRRITLLCHLALKNIAENNKTLVDEAVIKKIVDRETKEGWNLPDKATAQAGPGEPVQAGAKRTMDFSRVLPFLVAILIAGVIYLIVSNQISLRELNRPYANTTTDTSKVESFYQTAIGQLKEEQEKTSRLIAELNRSKNTQPVSATATSEADRQLKAAQESSLERMVAMMEKITRAQDEARGENKELTGRLTQLKSDFEALNDKLRSQPTAPPVKKTAGGIYIIRIISAAITPADWTDNDIGSKAAPPDCFVEVFQNNNSIFKSRVKLDTRTPVWDEDFSLKLRPGDKLEAVIFDEDGDVNERVLSWDNSESNNGELFAPKNNRLASPNESYLEYRVVTGPE